MSVAQLKEVHDRIRTGCPPAYSFQQDPSTKLFICLCQYQSTETRGGGSTKKDAQRAAARNMLVKLGKIRSENLPKMPLPDASIPKISSLKACNAQTTINLPRVNSTPSMKIDLLTEEQKTKAMRFLTEYRDDDPNSDARKSMAPEQYLIDEPDMGLKREDAPKSDTLESMAEFDDAIETFKRIMKEMKLKFFCKVPELKSEAGTEHIVLVQIYYRVHLMAGGMGLTVESATYSACANAIKMLRIYISWIFPIYFLYGDYFFFIRLSSKLFVIA